MFHEVYEECLIHELSKKNILAERQKTISVEFEELKFENAFIVDLLVEEKLVVGIKPESTQDGMFRRKVETYIRLCGQKTGLVLDFNTDDFRSSVRIIEKSFKPLVPPIQHYMYYDDYKRDSE